MAVKELALVDLSADEANELYEAPKFIRNQGPIRWAPSPQHARGLVVEIPVLAADGTELEVRGWYTPSSRKFGFAFLYKGVAIRHWDVHKKNRDVSRRRATVVEGPHKHKHNPDGPEPTDIYPVEDITTANVQQALLQFLAECGSETRGIQFEGIL